MITDDVNALLLSQGFTKLAEIDAENSFQVWRHQNEKIQLIIIPKDAATLIRGDKTYWLRSISEQGETWAREIGTLHDYLQQHFETLHLSLTFYRDVTKGLADRYAEERMQFHSPSFSANNLDALKATSENIHAQKQSLSHFASFIDTDDDLLHSYTFQQTARLNNEQTRIDSQLRHQQEMQSQTDQLANAYVLSGSGLRLTFSIGSNSHVVYSTQQFTDAVSSVRKELADVHRYQIIQKLNGGRLNIHVVESDEPAMEWLQRFASGGLTPRELERLPGQFGPFCKTAHKHTMVSADKDIQIIDTVRDNQKRIAAHAVKDFLIRLDKTEEIENPIRFIRQQDRPLWLGKVMTENKVTNNRAVFPLEKAEHIYLSGTTGAGKSFAGRILIEETLAYPDVNLLVLDPRNQSAGLLVREDRSDILQTYQRFNLKINKSHGFDVKYYTPTSSSQLAIDLPQVITGRSVVSFKGLDDKIRCEMAGKILETVLHEYAKEESDQVRLLIYLDEAHLFTRRRVNDQAKSSGQRSEGAIDRLVREGRKYGICVVIASQTIRDFAYDSASIRQNTNTKIFLRNSDREIEYASDFIGDGRQLIRLGVGEGYIYNANFGAIKVKFRPPYSKVWDFSVDAIRQLLSNQPKANAAVSKDSAHLLDLVRELTIAAGTPPHLSKLAQTASITSKRRLGQLIDELELAGLIRTRKLPERGQPRIVELLDKTDKTPDKMRTKAE